MKESITNRFASNGGIAPSSIPWHVIIHSDKKFKCGGTILDKNTILSVANCFLNNPKDSYVRAGITLKDDQNGQTVAIKQIIIHPQFDRFTNDIDISILKLKDSLQFDDFVQPACLPELNFDRENNLEWGVASGWTSISEGIY